MVACASEFSGTAEVKKLLADNEYTLLACKSKSVEFAKNIPDANQLVTLCVCFSCCGKITASSILSNVNVGTNSRDLLPTSLMQPEL